MRYEPEVISKNIKRTQKIKKILIIILYLLLIPTILFSVFLMFVELGNSDEVPSFFNMDVYIVVSESMSPKINVNDMHDRRLWEVLSVLKQEKYIFYVVSEFNPDWAKCVQSIMIHVIWKQVMK